MLSSNVLRFWYDLCNDELHSQLFVSVMKEIHDSHGKKCSMLCFKFQKLTIPYVASSGRVFKIHAEHVPFNRLYIAAGMG
jgi:hypothetical protein